MFDIQDAYNAFGLYASREEADLLIKRYDVNRDAKLNFSEFSVMFTPVEKSLASILTSRRANVANYSRREQFCGVT